MADFQKAVALLLKHEGTYSLDERDYGGETSFGISKRSYPNEDIAHMTQMRAEEIYRRDYWDVIRGSEIRDQTIAANLLDFAANAGVKTAVVTMQKILGVVPDGKVGPKTLSAINGATPGLNVIYVGERLAYYSGLAASRPEMRYALRAWIKRTADYA